MSVVQVAIVDDEDSEIKTLKAYLARYSEQATVSFEPDGFKSGLDFLMSAKTYDVVFLDIDMPGKDGMTVARKLRERDQTVIIIFVTNMAQYAIQGYEVAAFDYILKPVNYYAFAMKLQRVIRILPQRDEEGLYVDSDAGHVFLPFRHIRYIDVEKHYITIHTADNAYRVLMTLKNIEGKLPGTFQRNSRWSIVNLRFVSAVRHNEIELGGMTLPLTRSLSRGFTDKFAKYIAGGKI